jgi:nucleotide-binding universal stress UspA family protein
MVKPLKINSILWPTDLTPGSGGALRYALALSRAYESKLTICNWVEAEQLAKVVPVKDGPNVGLLDVEPGRPMFESTLLRFAGESALSGIDWQGLLIDGFDASDAITNTASECAADLIVMQSRRRPHRAALLGSTAESVCRTAPCPVLVTHSNERDWVQAFDKNISLHRILVPYDFSDYAELALNYALSFAQEYQAELHLLHVLPPHSVNEPEIAWYPKQGDSPYHLAVRRLQRVIPAEAHLWCTIKNSVSEGQPYREILNYAEKNEIDLISIGAHGAGFGMRALFGSNVDRVLRQAPCPVLVARPLKPATFDAAVESSVALSI